MSSYQFDSFDISEFCTRHNRAVKTAPRIFAVASQIIDTFTSFVLAFVYTIFIKLTCIFFESLFFFILEDNKYGDDVTVQGALENIYVLCNFFSFYLA